METSSNGGASPCAPANLHRIVTLTRRILAYSLWGIVIGGGFSMAGEAEPKTPEERRQDLIDGIRYFDTFRLTRDRRACMDHRMGPILAGAAVISGEGTQPSAREQCVEVVRVGVTGTLPFDPYVDIVREQLGLPGNVERDDDYAAVGSDNIAGLVWTVVQSANNGSNAYGGADRELHRLSCPMALDAGATWMATRGASDAVRFPLTPEEIATIAEACYDPNVTELPFRDHGNVPITTLGLLAGENLGRIWMDTRDLGALAVPTIPAVPGQGAASGPDPPSRP
jgi:hypothetical protein